MNFTKEDLLEAEMIHLFEQYDMPLYFVDKMSNGDLLLNYYIEEIEQKDVWFISKITEHELTKILNKEFSTLEILNELLNSSRLYYCTIPYESDGEMSLELVTFSNIDEEAFPKEDFYIKHDFLNS